MALVRAPRIFCVPEYVSSPEYHSFWRGVTAGNFRSGAFERLEKFGQVAWLSAIYNPAFDSQSRLWKLVKVAREITKNGVMAVQTTVDLVKSISGYITRAAEEISMIGQPSDKTTIIARTISSIAGAGLIARIAVGGCGSKASRYRGDAWLVRAYRGASPACGVASPGCLDYRPEQVDG